MRRNCEKEDSNVDLFVDVPFARVVRNEARYLSMKAHGLRFERADEDIKFLRSEVIDF